MRVGRVAIVGWTNVGKSTLLNGLVGERVAAVADVAQTTRRRILGVLRLADRAEIALVDTPGIHRPRDRMNRALVRIATDTLGDVDATVVVVDAAAGIGAGDVEILERVRRTEVPVVVALNKVDLVQPKERLLPLIEEASRLAGTDRVVPVSARTGDGTERLLEVLAGSLPEGTPRYDEDYFTDQTERDLVAERVREKLMECTREELPHAIAVGVTHWTEPSAAGGATRVDVEILVERDSQKGIVIGKGGVVLRDAGTAARRELEELLDRRLDLRLWVRVRRDWRNDRDALREMGVLDP